jgi:hypothetical protein
MAVFAKGDAMAGKKCALEKSGRSFNEAKQPSEGREVEV